MLTGRRGHRRVQLFSLTCAVERDHVKSNVPVYGDSSGIELLALLDPGRPGLVPVGRTGALLELDQPYAGRLKVVAADLHSREPYPDVVPASV